MPVEHLVDKEQNLLRVRRWGHVSTHDEVQACEVRRRDPLVVPGIPVVVDCTGVDPADDPETIRYIAECTASIAHELQCGPMAIVVSSDVEYGMARMYMAYTDLAHPDTRVFRTEEDALDWLRTQRAVP